MVDCMGNNLPDTYYYVCFFDSFITLVSHTYYVFDLFIFQVVLDLQFLDI